MPPDVVLSEIKIFSLLRMAFFLVGLRDEFSVRKWYDISGMRVSGSRRTIHVQTVRTLHNITRRTIALLSFVRGLQLPLNSAELRSKGLTGLYLR